MDVFPRDELFRLVNRASLPGVSPEEVRALREWIRRQGDQYDELRFNVRVGVGVTLEGDYTDKFKGDWFERTRMRPDLVGFRRPSTATLVEGKVQWTNEAVWQLLHYRDLYRDEHPSEAIELVGVCEAFTPQGRALALASAIRLFVYGFPGELPLEPATSASS
ncbi:MAG: hypothetical protein LC750_16785 [Actinobacteria bacterium]|nr:hypothetical protein [Actinomycetota bacterium]